MLYKADDLQGFHIAASDGELGKVSDLYFDDREWRIRYFVVDTGGWLSGRLVLISPDAAGHPDADEKTFHVSLTKKQVEDSPGVETDLPFSRQQEIAYREYFGWPPYWGGISGAAGFAVHPEQVAVADRDAAERRRTQAEADPHLRSAGIVRGYSLAATDGDIGHIDDLIVDDDGWAVRYFVIDTRNWLPGKKVLLAPEWVQSIDWSRSEVAVSLARDTIKEAPEYDHSAEITREYEARLHEHYGQRAYWI